MLTQGHSSQYCQGLVGRSSKEKPRCTIVCAQRVAYSKKGDPPRFFADRLYSYCVVLAGDALSIIIGLLRWRTICANLAEKQSCLVIDTQRANKCSSNSVSGERTEAHCPCDFQLGLPKAQGSPTFLLINKNFRGRVGKE